MNNQAVYPKEKLLSWEVFAMGGLSIIVCMAAWAFMDKSSSLATMANFAFGLAFMVNHPHFLSSYVLLYGDFRKNIFKRKRYFWGAVVVPVILAGAFITALTQSTSELMGHIITTMYFLVGWHYVKQVFGCVIVTSAMRRLYYKNWERKLMLLNLFSVWFMSWLQSHVGNNHFEFYGIPHSSLDLPAWTLQTTYWVVALSFLATLWMHMRKYINDGRMPSAPGMAAFFSLYAWYLPTFSHPGFAYLIPLFHSLQYLAFVWILKRNQVAYDTRTLEGKSYREAWVQKFIGFIFMSCGLGALFFEFIPKQLDTFGLFRAGLFGTAPFLATFILFINIHHYFIDNVIWRSDNEVVKKFLMQAPAAEQGKVIPLAPTNKPSKAA